MINIVQRLREGVDPNEIADAERAMDEAADEIERLRVERDALQQEVERHESRHLP